MFTSAFAFSQTEEETKTPKIRKFAFTFTPLEAGGTIPLKSKKSESLPGPISIIANNKKSSIHFNVLKLGMVYKELYGIEAFYNFGSPINYNSAALEKYLSNSHPNYDVPENINHDYTNTNITWKGWQIGLYYRVKIRNRFYIEPKFQMGFEKYTQGNFEYFLKEHGSNQFIEYSLRSEDPKTIIPSYHYILNFSYRFNPGSPKIKTELGIKFEYIFMNLNLKYNIREQAYGQAAINSSYSVKQPFNLMVIALYGKLYY
jgi:hypothetical protein